MLVATGFTPLLVNFESGTAKPRVGEGSKNYVTWKVEKAVHYTVHTDNVIADSSTGKGKYPQPLESCLMSNMTLRFLNAF